MAEVLPGQLGRYLVTAKLGQGGAGAVYRATDTILGREVAVKIFRPSDEDAEAPERFRREAQVAARLLHPNIAAIYDIGTTDTGALFVVQELVTGADLAQIIKGNPAGLPAPVAAHLLARLAAALDYIHGSQILHRDIKPSNVAVMPDGTVKLLDFGIARPLGTDLHLTRTGALIGTPLYMAPEVIRGEAGVGVASDIYSFGVLAFQLLTGRLPFEAESQFSLLSKVVEQPAPALSGNSAYPPVLALIVDQCLAKKPEKRPASMKDIATLLEKTPQAWDLASFPRQTARERPPTDGSSQTDDKEQPSTLKSPVTPPPPPRYTPADLSGQTVGRFVLHERIARGSSGDLYKAWDPVRGDLVAVKVLRTGDTLARERMMRGGRLWVGIHHPNVLRVHELHPDYGGFPGVIVMDLVDAPNLEEFARHQHLNLDRVLRIALQLCDALHAIHAKGVVHREVKPRNILVSRETLHVTLLDSGIARDVNPEVDNFTRTFQMAGDLSYVPPEQIKGRPDQRTDVYAAVAVVYELVTRARLPFPVPENWQPDASTLERAPSRLRAVIARGLHADADQRFASIAELRDHLRTFGAGEASPAPRAVVALHGIRTQAARQRAFSEVAGTAGLGAHFDRWNFGYFSALRFLMPWARMAKVRWLRETYQREFHDQPGTARGELPSIVAHSFGTYILGNALLRYPYLRFNKVLLCGSILPTDFPWDRLIERGQVQAVRNEFGSEDIWTRAVGWFVPGTGPSGLTGFDVRHPRLEQERFDFAHSEYFERSHMKSRWLPYLTVQVAERPAQEAEVQHPRSTRPWGSYVVYGLFVAAVFAALTYSRS